MQVQNETKCKTINVKYVHVLKVCQDITNMDNKTQNFELFKYYLITHWMYPQFLSQHKTTSGSV